MILNKMQQEVLSRKSGFDPNNEEHMKQYSYFLKNSRWNQGCPFFLEWPHVTIPDMIKDKIVRNMFNAKMV